ncbi:MAG: diphthine synthase [Candidatus Bathyarchaeota archaeon]|nr:MAG: diphthine synthase [Candidatus Bathyarchaeota archaeon]
MTLTLISIGLADERDLSQRALEEAKSCDALYAELYTTVLDTDADRLAAAIGRPVKPLPRRAFEESSDALLREAEAAEVGVLIGGDALSATTHVSLLLEARKRGTPVRVVHGSSALTAVAETGLSLYKLGRTVTLPLPGKGTPDTVLRTLGENREHGLHTLVLLDLDTEAREHLTIDRAIETLLDAERPGTFGADTLTVGVARLGWANPDIKAGRPGDLREHDFDGPPQALIVPGRLHFLEAEALKVIGGCPTEILEDWVPRGEVERLIVKYGESCRRAVEKLEYAELPSEVSREVVKTLIEHAVRYLEDAEHYAEERRATALASVSYAEGILDALRLLGLVEFEW